MEVGSTGSSALQSYQSTLKTSGQSAAVLQALANAYKSASSDAASSDTDPLAALAGASAISALTVGINTVSQAIKAASGDTSQTSAVSYPATYGGMDASSAKSLLASTASSSDTSGLQGFGSALDPGATLAVAAYQAQQDYGTTSTANGSGTTSGTAQSGGATDATTTAYLQAIAQANLTSNLNLLA
jgi:hypothetical protein